MRGASPRTIQELAGHTDLQTTQRYMHLAPAALREAIGLLDLRGRGTYLAPRQTVTENFSDSNKI